MEKMGLSVAGRREFLLSAGAGALLLAALPRLGHAQDKPPTAPATFDEALKKLVGDAKPIEGKLMFDIPEIAENGNTVPFMLSVASPMTDADHVKALHVLASANPQPGVVSFHLTPASGKASVASRMRLSKTQDVVAVAELSDGKVLISKRLVKVTIGGCGG